MGFLEMSDYEIAKEFESVKKQIIVSNYINLMQEKLIPFHESLALAQGKNKDEEEIWAEAHQAFCTAKRLGRLDELNVVIEDEDC